MTVGKIFRFDESRGYGFIAPVDGGEDVFVHVNDFGEHRPAMPQGVTVEYEAEESDRGLKVKTLKIVGSAANPVRLSAPPVTRLPAAHFAGPDDDGMCDVLETRAFSSEVTELLIENVPSLTGSQISQIRSHLVELARSHSWLEN